MTVCITPCKNIVSTGGQDAQIVGDLDTLAAVHVSTNNTGQQLPAMTGGSNAADYYKVSSDVRCNILIGSTQAEAEAVSTTVGTTLEIGESLFIGRRSALGWIAKLDL